MIYDGSLVGKYVTLKSVLEKDAEVTLSMRTNKEKTKFLHPVENNLEKQKDWIRSQNEKDDDYFFLAYNKKDVPVGTIGVSEIKNDVGHLGRVLSYGNPLESFELYYLSLLFSFDILHLKEIWGDVDPNNLSSLNFSKQFGAVYDPPVKDSDLDRMVCYFRLNKETVMNSGIIKFLYRNKDPVTFS